MEITINYNGQLVSVEVSAQVYAYLDQAAHKEENLAHEQRRHWDWRSLEDYIVSNEAVKRYQESPEEWLCRMETRRELISVLNRCTAVQRQRFLLYALDGFSYAQIGTLCGCSKYAARDSVVSVRKIFKKTLRDRPHD